MDTNPVTYQTKTATEKNILSHLEDCDNNFTPPLSERTGLVAYAKKLFEKAVTFEAWNNDRLIGLIAAYLNTDDSRSVFITNVSVTKEFTGKGIASRLLRNCIAHCAKNDYFVINLEVNRNNSRAIGFYEKHQFKQSGTQGDNLVLTLNLK
ncbi:MAG TPA: GNAT family N-acetyltransferase [Chitinophagaceae bacterium]|nr:GNAT family N-acetyltransferase [Chitinophagaceae bacterium]